MDGEPPYPADVTRILHEWKDGNREALDRLIPIVYEELRTSASRQLAREWRHDRLQTTTVVNEAYVKLFAQRQVDWQNRGHFFALAAQLMRRILVDHARRRKAAKRGGGAPVTVYDEGLQVAGGRPIAFDDLDQALVDLSKLSERQAKVVELRYFGGLSIEETGESLGISAVPA